MTDQQTLSLDQYRTALGDVRAMQSRLIQSERAALRKQIAKLQTLEGRADQRRRAQAEAARYIETARIAALIAGQHIIADRYGETDTLGRNRIEAATAERLGMTIEQFRISEATKHKPKPLPVTPAPAGDPYEGRHGYADAWDEGCRCPACRLAHRRVLNAEHLKRKAAA